MSDTKQPMKTAAQLIAEFEGKPLIWLVEAAMSEAAFHADTDLADTLSGQCWAAPESTDISADQCIELAGELQKEWLRKAIAGTRTAASLLGDVSFRAGMESACDEIETRFGDGFQLDASIFSDGIQNQPLPALRAIEGEA